MSAPSPVHGTASLTLKINDSEYRLVFLCPDPRVANPAWRLFKLDGSGEKYDVHFDAHGCQCTCADFHWRRNGKDPGGCKHVRALDALGLMKFRGEVAV